jgi:hypothetical protein
MICVAFVLKPEYGDFQQLNRSQVRASRDGLKQTFGLRGAFVMGILARRVGVRRRRGIFQAGLLRTGMVLRVSVSRVGAIFLEAFGGFRQVLEQVVNTVWLGSGKKNNEQGDRPQRNDRP